MNKYTQLRIPNDSAWDRKTWRYYSPHWFTNFIDGVRNIISWVPLLYKNKDWDSVYIYDILEFKLLKQRNYLVNANRHTSIPETNKYITICLNLIDKVKNEYYSMESYNFYDISFNFTPIEGETSKLLESEIVWEDYDSYLSKYPLQVKKILTKYPDLKNDKYRISLLVSRENHERAQSLLFKILNQQLPQWWD
jgi:hypothetical protein